MPSLLGVRGFSSAFTCHETAHPLARQFLDRRTYRAARATPERPEIYQHGLFTLDDFLLNGRIGHGHQIVAQRVAFRSTDSAALSGSLS
jgi:hypothetical protein